MKTRNYLILVPQVELNLLVQLIRRRKGNSDDESLQEILIGSIFRRKPMGRAENLKIVKRKKG